MSISIENELANCRKSAEEGYALAKQEFDDIQQTLRNAATSLSKTDQQQNQITRIQNTKLIDEQRQELRRLKAVIDPISKDLEKLREHSRDFSIVVYGRTMAGKSTLMEILTHGNGKSIGTCSQRTTLDVRNYYWNGLKITDVPGISAFGGAVDEEVALEATKAADLIIFLLTSDAPQADEAEKLAQLRSLGKPVLGIINVKMSFNIGDELDLEDLKDRLADTETIDITLQQFKNFSAKHNQDWSNIKFVPTHLLSAYQSQDTNPEVFKISRFTEVEDFILEKVRDDGRFLRIKTFVDIVAIPMNNIILKIYEQAGKTLLESGIYSKKRQQLIEWKQSFQVCSAKKFEDLYKQLQTKLENAMYYFIDNHYEDEKAGKNWEETFKKANFDKRYEDLLKSLAAECERKRKELSDELTQEISYTFSGKTKTNVEMDGTTTWGKYASIALGGLGGVGGFILSRGIGVAFPPLGIALTVISILGGLFSDSKEEKIKKNKEKLREGIKEPSYKVLKDIHDTALNIFKEEILGKGIDELIDTLTAYQFMLARLAKNQSDMANSLFKEYEDLNFRLLNEAIEYKNAGRIRNFEALARIPGETMIVFANGRNLNTAKLSDLLGESVTVVNPCANAEDTLKLVLHRNFDIKSYKLDSQKQDELQAVLLEDNVDTTSYKIAQQVAGIPIIMKNQLSYQINTQPPKSSQQVKTQTYNQNVYSDNNYLDAGFQQVANLLSNPRKNEKAIINILKILEETAESQKDAAAMEKIGDYYGAICQFKDAARCSELAETFAQENSYSGNDEFRAGFRPIKENFSNTRTSNNNTGNVRQSKKTAETQHDTGAMRKISDYYDEISKQKDSVIKNVKNFFRR